MRNHNPYPSATARLLRAAGIEATWDEIDLAAGTPAELPGLKVADATWDEWQDARAASLGNGASPEAPKPVRRS